MTIIHDIAEIRIGDITPDDGVSLEKKHELESEAMKEILSQFPRGDELYEVWLEYEKQSTPESKFVKYCDKLDMSLQAQKYMANSDLNLNEFIDSAISKIDDDYLKGLANFNRYQY